MTYSGPLRDEPLAVELHNTIYATSGGRVDAFDDPAQMRAWLEAIEPRLAGGLPRGAWPCAEDFLALADGLPRGARPCAADLVALRDHVRAVLQAVATGSRPSQSSLVAINAASRRAPRALVAVWHPGDHPTPGTDFASASRADVVLGTFAAGAIDLICGPSRDDLRTCGAPGCVLMFVKRHPRREWCSDRCGNRARQARHYERTRPGGAR
jgi:predicted RNA-binding Zn ribbon-like protein